jgi:hypothetical protein
VWNFIEGVEPKLPDVRSIASLDDGRRIMKGGGQARGTIAQEIAREEQAMFRTSISSAGMECKSVRLWTR